MNATMKKVLAVLLVVVLTAAVSIGATLAFLTDRDNETNVFTLGNVDIQLNEEFEQGAELMPGIKVQKETTITNIGDNDAWVWMTLAVPAALDDATVTTVGENNVLHWNMPGCFWNGYHDNQKYINSGIQNGYLPEDSTGVEEGDTWINKNESTVEVINGVEYNVYPFLYKGALVPGETTNIALSEIYVDSKVDVDPNGQWHLVKNGEVTEVDWNTNEDGYPIVYINAYAMQKENFADVEAAVAAYKTQWGGLNGEKTPVTAVTDLNELSEALAEGGNIVLADDIEAAEEVLVDGDVDVVLDLNGKALDISDDRAIKVDGSATLTLKNGTVNAKEEVLGVFGDGQIIAEDVVFNGKYCFGMNGSETTENSSATFTNCEFHITSGYSAAYISANGTYTFKDCVIEGGEGILIRSGDVTLDGCTIIANGYNGKDKAQTDVYANYKITETTEAVKDGIAFWNKSAQEGSTGDCVTIVYNSGTAYDLKGVTIKNCKFQVVNAVEVNGEQVATGYAVRVFTKNADKAPEIDYSNLVLENNTDMNGNAIETGDLGLVYSYYPKPAVPDVWDGTVTEVEVSEDGYYHISTGAELAYINTILKGRAEGLGIKVILEADLDLNNMSWNPIGQDDTNPFQGTFDGNGHTVSNVNVDGAYDNAGLFGFVKFGGTTVKKLTVENVTVSGTSERVGGLVGMMNGGTVAECKVVNAQLSVGEKVGGIIGDMVGVALSDSSVTDSTITSTEHAGALAGRIRTDGSTPTVSNCTATDCTITGAADATGELVGTQLVTVDLTGSEATNCTVIKK